MPKGGKRPGAGNPGYGKQIAVREGVERLTPRWFEMIEEMMNTPGRGKDSDARFALDQLGKLMGKLMPTEVTGKDGGPIEQRIIYLPQREPVETTSRQTNGNTADNTPAGI